MVKAGRPLAGKQYRHLEYNVIACTNSVRSEVFFWSALPLVCLILDHLLCPDCVMAVLENARQHRGHIVGERVIGVTGENSLKVRSERAIGRYYIQI